MARKKDYRYAFSPSALGIFKDCKRCFWHQMKDGLRRPDGITPSLPSGMDWILKDHFDSYQGTNELPPSLAMLEGMSLFDDREKLKVWQNNYVGINTRVGQDLVRGAVDYMLQQKTDDGVVLSVIDFKTRGWPLKQDSVDRYQFQLGLYNWMLQQNGFKTTEHGYLLYIDPASAIEPQIALNKTDSVLYDFILKKNKITRETAASDQQYDPARVLGMENCRAVSEIKNEHAVSLFVAGFNATLLKLPASAEDARDVVYGAIELLEGKTIPSPDEDCGNCTYVRSRARHVSKERFLAYVAQRR